MTYNERGKFCNYSKNRTNNGATARGKVARLERLKVGVWNIRTLNSALHREQIRHIFLNRGFDIIALMETHLTSSGRGLLTETDLGGRIFQGITDSGESSSFRCFPTEINVPNGKDLTQGSIGGKYDCQI